MRANTNQEPLSGLSEEKREILRDIIQGDQATQASQATGKGPETHRFESLAKHKSVQKAIPLSAAMKELRAEQPKLYEDYVQVSNQPAPEPPAADTTVFDRLVREDQAANPDRPLSESMKVARRSNPQAYEKYVEAFQPPAR